MKITDVMPMYKVWGIVIVLVCCLAITTVWAATLTLKQRDATLTTSIQTLQTQKEAFKVSADKAVVQISSQIIAEANAIILESQRIQTDAKVIMADAKIAPDQQKIIQQRVLDTSCDPCSIENKKQMLEFLQWFVEITREELAK